MVLPLRSFTHGKARLATELAASRRSQFVRDMADRVADAAGERHVVVVTSAVEVIAWAHTRGFDVVDDPGSLDAAADAGRIHLRDAGRRRVVVAHGDLPLARTFDPVAEPDADARDDRDDNVVVIVPCHRGDGTPVLSLPAALDFPFAYGPGSFARHCAAAAALGLDVRVGRDPALGFDVDVPDDLVQLDAHARS